MVSLDLKDKILSDPYPSALEEVFPLNFGRGTLSVKSS